jgi:hypothetical protein
LSSLYGLSAAKPIARAASLDGFRKCSTHPTGCVESESVAFATSFCLDVLHQRAEHF